MHTHAKGMQMAVQQGRSTIAQTAHAVTIARPPVVYQPANIRIQSRDEVSMLKEALRDAEAERDLLESRLAQHEIQSKLLESRQRQLAMSQAKTKLCLADLKSMLGDARHGAATEHRKLFGDRVQVMGKSFSTEAGAEAFFKRQEEGMERLGLYDARLTAMTGSLKATIQGPAM